MPPGRGWTCRERHRPGDGHAAAGVSPLEHTGSHSRTADSVWLCTEVSHHTRSHTDLNVGRDALIRASTAAGVAIEGAACVKTGGGAGSCVQSGLCPWERALPIIHPHVCVPCCSPLLWAYGPHERQPAPSDSSPAKVGTVLGVLGGTHHTLPCCCRRRSVGPGGDARRVQRLSASSPSSLATSDALLAATSDHPAAVPGDVPARPHAEHAVHHSPGSGVVTRTMTVTV